MLLKRLLVLLPALYMAVSVAHAQGNTQANTLAVSLFESARTFRCEFPQGSVQSWQEGVAVNASEMSVIPEIIYDNLDRKRATGRIIGNVASGDITVMPAAEALHLVELTGNGNLNITSIFPAQAADGRFLAAHSRHTGHAQAPVAGHYSGSCLGL